jgi:hypothetical protein
MVTLAMDTHRIVKRLRDAGFSDVQAERVTDLLKETREVDLSQLATKSDIADLATRADLRGFATKADLEARRTGLKSEIAQPGGRIIKWIVPLMIGQTAVIVAFLRLL